MSPTKSAICRSRAGGVRAAAFVGVAALLGGCSFFSFLPWIEAEPEELKEGEPAKLVDFEPEADIDRLWRAKVGRGLGRKYVRLAPVVVADRVYAADGYGRVVAVNRFDGEPVWSTTVGEPDEGPFYEFWDRRDPSFVSGGLGAGEGRILLGTTRGEVIALDAGDGSELWRSTVSSEVLARPASAEDVVLAQTADGRLFALEADDGRQRWAYDSQVPLLTLRGTSAPLAIGGFVFAGFGDGSVSAVAQTNGAPIWKHRVMLPQGRTEMDRLVDVDATPLFANGRLYAVSFQGRLKALGAQDGSLVWEMEASSHLDLAEGYGQIYVVGSDDVVTAVGQTSAAVVWEQDALLNRGLTSPIAFGNYLLVGDSDGYLHVLAQSDGRFIARRKLAGGLRSPMVEVEGAVFVLTNSGRLEALRITRRG